MSADRQVMEHRWGTRVPVELAALIRYGAKEIPVHLRNASLSGIFVQTTERLPLLARVEVCTAVDGLEWIEACVVRIAPDGIALEWLEPGTAAVLTLATPRHQRPSERISDSRRAHQDSALEWPVQTDALARARSEVESGEFDVQG